MLLESLADINPRLLDCPSTWTALSTGCYLFLPGPIKWDDAVARCEEENSSLVEVETAVEQDALAEEALKKKGDIFGFWIGMTDRKEEGRWVWQSGKEVNFTAWHGNQPDNRGNNQNCGNIWLGGRGEKGGKWDDANGMFPQIGNLIYGAICEFKKGGCLK